MTSPGRGERAGADPSSRVALAVTLAGALAFVALAALLVPWDPAGAPLDLPSASSVLTPAELARSEEYSRAARITSWASLAVSLATVVALAWSRAGRVLAKKLRGPWWWQVVQAVLAVSLLVRAVTLPFAVLAQARRRRYGLSTQGWDGWARDVATNLLLGVVVTSLVLLVLVACARRWRRAWPAVAGLLLAALVLLGSFVYPLVVEPLFNSFTSLPEGPLRSEVLAVAAREGVPVDDVLVADASRRTTTLNAYVSGFGSTRRVVLYDNLVDGLPPDQALSVVAHELAHARHRDVLVGSALGATGVVAGIGLLGLVVGSRPVRRRYAAGLATGAAMVPLLVALVDVGSLAASPVQNGLSRRIELRADVDALKATGDPVAFEAMQVQLTRRSLADPSPPALSQWWFGSHPTMLERLALARRTARAQQPVAPREAWTVSHVLEKSEPTPPPKT